MIKEFKNEILFLFVLIVPSIFVPIYSILVILFLLFFFVGIWVALK